jgi:phosphate-selective porin
LGAYNGQGANTREINDNYHVVARASYPWKTESGQIYEVGVQGYTGKYMASVGSGTSNLVRQTPSSSTVAPTIDGGSSYNQYGIKDERAAISFMMYPMPFGLQGEWNWGKTPGLDMTDLKVKEQKLNGGYVQAFYKIDHVKVGDTDGTVIPFIKYQYFDGFNKAETNAPQNKVNDWEAGAEWQIAPEVELVAYLHHMNRTNVVTGAPTGVADYAKFKADALRVQLQYNF